MTSFGSFFVVKCCRKKYNITVCGDDIYYGMWDGFVMKRFWGNILIIVLLCSSVMGHLVPVWAEDGEVVRVGYYEMPGFQYKDEDGNLCGYNIEYLNMVAAITGWSYEFVEVDYFFEGSQMLADREIDLLAPCMMTAEREKQFLFSELDFGTEYTVLVTDKDNDDLYYEDYKNFQGITVALVEGYPMCDYFKQYMGENLFTSELVYYDTPTEALLAVQNGEVDAAVTSQMAIEDEYKILARFSQMPFYYITWKGNQSMLRQLDRAMKQLQNTYPSLIDNLCESYFPDYDMQYFTRAEVEFIENSRTYKVAYMPDWKPLSFMNEDGELDGISRAIFDEIQAVSGLRFEYEPLPQGEISYEYLAENNFDIVTGVSYNSANLNSKGILLSEPYMSGKKVMVGRNETNFDVNRNMTIGIVKGSKTFDKIIKEEYPNFKIVEFDTIKACFDAVDSGEVSLLMMNQYLVDNWLVRPRYEELKIIPIAGISDELCFSTVVEVRGFEGMSMSDSAMLITIIDKVLANISEDKLDDLVLQATLENQYDYTLNDFLYHYRHTVAVSVVMILASVSLILYINWLKKKEERKIHLQQKRYKHILDNSGDMIYEICMQGDAGVFSDKIHQKFGWEIPKNMEGFSVDNLPEILHIHPEDKDTFNDATERIIFNKENVELQVRIGCETGEYIWCNVTGIPLFDDNDKLLSILGKIEDINEAVKEKKSLELKSRTDGLTGLMNKQTFAYETEKFLSENTALHSGIIFIDMDNFKNINDTMGHAMGDKVIVDTAKKIQVIFANFDYVARFGGDEFCVFVKNIPKETLLDKLSWAVEKLHAEYNSDNGNVTISASIGAAYCASGTTRYEMLLESADKAVYEAKEKGRNCYVVIEI